MSLVQYFEITADPTVYPSNGLSSSDARRFTLVQGNLAIDQDKPHTTARKLWFFKRRHIRDGFRVKQHQVRSRPLSKFSSLRVNGQPFRRTRREVCYDFRDCE